jgi:2-furoyl-CoA dehydrogenase FAD binding subunit
MKPKEFDYVLAESTEEAVAELATSGEDAKILAGGQTLGAMMNLRLVEVEVLIDIARIGALDYIRAVNGSVEVGAAATQASLLNWPELSGRLPLLNVAMPHIGHYQTRNRGTVCGSLAHSDPSSELPLCLATLGGEVVLRSARGERVLKAGDFQRGVLSTARAPNEMIAAARFPTSRPGEGFAFREVARRRGDFAIVAVAAMVDSTRIRLGVGGVADRPTVAEWDLLDGSALDDALNAFAWELGGYDDIHATAKYRRRLVRTLGRQAIEEARTCRS